MYAYTRLQVNQTCPMGYILAHILSLRRFKDINLLDTSMMEAIGERFKGVVPFHGGTQKWDILSLFLFYASIFDI